MPHALVLGRRNPLLKIYSSVRPIFAALCLLSISGCALDEGRVFAECPRPTKKSAAAANAARARLKDTPSINEISETAGKPGGQEQLESNLNDYVNHWFYGQGLGQSTLNIGGIILFPPYALLLLGNAGIALSGYEPVAPLSYIPGQAGDYVRASYDAITGVPGRATSAVAGEPFEGEDPCIP